MSENNKLPVAVRENVRRLGVYVMAETFSLMTKPKPDHLTSIIKINRGIAAGLRGKAVTTHTASAGVARSQAPEHDQAASGISKRSRPRRCGMRLTSIFAASIRI